jgi:hypothetical protein
MGNNDILERVHLKFCKLLFNLKTSTPSYMIYGELERYPIEIDVKVRIISFWTKLCCGKESKLFVVLNMQKSMSPGVQNSLPFGRRV